MADEAQTPGIEDVNAPDFDWGRFFESEGSEPEVAPAVVPVAAAPGEVDEEEAETTQLKSEIEELKQMVAETAKVTREISTTSKVTAAVEAWKQQASPAELAMADVLAEATSLEDLQAKASLVKRVAQGADKMLASERLKIEQQMQRDFGLPITPSFQPIPDQAEYEAAKAAGDIDKMAALATKGLFNI